MAEWIRDLPKLDKSEIDWVKSEGFYSHTASLVLAAVGILQEYQSMRLTIRQLYYQMVSRGYIYNSLKAYQNFDSLLVKAREKDIIPWDTFEDRARRFIVNEDHPVNIEERDPVDTAVWQIEDAAIPRDGYGLPRWYGQPNYIEIWVEKDALAGFIEPITLREDVPLVVSRGYTSYTFKQEALKRFLNAQSQEKEAILLYLGDLDPSGWDIYQVLKDEFEPEGIAVSRLALLPEQVVNLNLPPCPIKDTDSRANGFRTRFPGLGNDCYELDALPPDRLISLVQSSIKSVFDEAVYEEREQKITSWYDVYKGELSRLSS